MLNGNVGLFFQNLKILRWQQQSVKPHGALLNMRPCVTVQILKTMKTVQLQSFHTTLLFVSYFDLSFDRLD